MSLKDLRIIDFHTHPYLEQTENLCKYTENFLLSPEEVKKDLKRTGIGKICGSVISTKQFSITMGYEEIQKLNSKAIEIKRYYNDFYEPGFHIHPAFVKESLNTIEFMHQNGYRLIGEIVPYLHGWLEAELDFSSKSLQEILALAGEYNMIFSYHVMKDWQGQMEQMIATNPNVIFVAAHPGNKANFLMQLDKMKKYENAYLDLSGLGLYFYGMLREGIRCVGDERFLFGTDYPIINPAMYVQAVNFEHISEASREKIFYKNAERILLL
ncbi:MAG: amidohydrolase family protein [Lachnospiraceae bacterium]|nr:amidohydrolase family protein [Lachnospiraceae bacterium]